MLENLLKEQEAKVHTERQQHEELLALQKQSMVAAHTAKEELVYSPFSLVCLVDASDCQSVIISSGCLTFLVHRQSNYYRKYSVSTQRLSSVSVFSRSDHLLSFCKSFLPFKQLLWT